MSPIWSILHDHIASGESGRCDFFYGARTQADLFYLDRIAAITAAHPEIHLHPGAVARRRRRRPGTASAASSTRWCSDSCKRLGIERRWRRLCLRPAADDRCAAAGAVHAAISSPTASSSTSSRRPPVRRPTEAQPTASRMNPTTTGRDTHASHIQLRRFGRRRRRDLRRTPTAAVQLLRAQGASARPTTRTSRSTSSPIRSAT